MLVSLGDLVADVVVVPRQPAAPADDTPSDVVLSGGGQAANWCAWVIHLGGSARLVTRLGDDIWGRHLRADLEMAGVDVRAVVDAGRTGAIVVVVGPDGERSFYTQRGAIVDLRPEQVERAWLADATLLHLPLYSLMVEPLAGAARQAAHWARESGALLSVDLSSAAGIRRRGAAAVTQELSSMRPDLIFATERETEALDAPLDGLTELPIVKLGRGGCRIRDRLYPAEARQAVDTTGAGDAFAAGFCLAYDRRRDADAAVRAALAAGAAAIGKLGGRP